jgi:ribose 5-phosphate isomerase
MDIPQLKQKAGWYAVDFVKSGMVVGLGHGSTAIFAVRCIAQLLQEERLQDVLSVPCSRHVEAEARRLGIPLTTLDEHPVVDLTIDGADEVDPDLKRSFPLAGARRSPTWSRWARPRCALTPTVRLSRPTRAT